MEEFACGGFRCIHEQTGTGGPVILWGTFSREEDAFPHTWDCIKALTGDTPLHLLAFEVTDWDRDFSPWPSDTEYRGQRFPGGGRETLRRLTENLVPELLRRYDTDGRVYLIGYSLAGLFALWSLYESDCFAGGASCSGSLWYEGFGTYADTRKILAPAEIYLSLGGKEASGSDPVTGTVGAETKAEEKRLKNDPNVRRSTFVLNPGGHFADSGKRLAKGVAWLLS